MKEIKGIIVPILTPMHEDETVNYEELVNQIERLIAAGVHGIFVFGTNGEGYILDEEEKAEIIRVAVKTVNGRVPVYAGTGCVSTRDTIRMSRKAKELGADVLSIITPSFAAASQEELIQHYETVANAVDMPILLYNIPARTGNALAPATVQKLSQVANIVGAKDSSGNFDNILQYIEKTRGGDKPFTVLSGNDSLILWTLLAVACTYVTAYVLSRPRFKHRYWLMSLFIITWVFDAGIIPQYIIYNQFGFVNSPWVMIVPGAISTQFLIITKTFLEGIPNELEEAAVVDGASDIKILTRVFLPLSPTVLATTGLFYAVSIWNQYLIPQIYLKDDAIKTIQQVLKNVVITDGGSGTTFKNVVLDGVTLNQQNLKAAAIFIAMLPIICVYPFVQKYFKKGILIGSVKG